MRLCDKATRMSCKCKHSQRRRNQTNNHNVCRAARGEEQEVEMECVSATRWLGKRTNCLDGCVSLAGLDWGALFV